MEPSRPQSRLDVLEAIESSVADILNSLIDYTDHQDCYHDRDPNGSEPSHTSGHNTASDVNATSSSSRRIPYLNLSIRGLRPCSFPGRSVQEAHRFAVIIRVLSIIHGAVSEDIVITKRDIFYRDPELFGNQAVVDRVVDGLARGMGVGRSLLNVTASSKGRVVGGFTWMCADGRRVSGMGDRSGIMISMIAQHDVLDINNISWILVIEKDATFNMLASAGLHCSSDLEPGLMITAKGYPDIATRAFLRKMSISHYRSTPAPPIFALVDNDPDGLSILSTYKYGSLALTHENDRLRVSRMHWIGIKSSELLHPCIQASPNADPENEISEHQLLRLTGRDRKKAESMLQSSVCDESGPEPEWRRELQTMLMTNVKAEIQVLEGRPGGTVEWLKARLPKRSTLQRSSDDFPET